MQIDSIFTKLPNEIQAILGKEDSNNWINLLNKEQKDTKQDGEYLATLLLCLAKHDTIAVKKRDMVCQFLEKKEQNKELSSMANTTYCTAKIYIENLKTLSVNRKRKATETVEQQLPKKQQTREIVRAQAIEQQTREMVRAQVIEQQTSLPKPLSDLISQYEITPFPGVRATFDVQHDFSPELSTSPLSAGVVLGLCCKTSGDRLGIDCDPRQDLKYKFSFTYSVSEVQVKLVQKYFEDHSLLIDYHRNSFEGAHFTIYKKQNALLVVDLLTDCHTFPNGMIEKLKTIITTHFNE